MLQDWTFDTDNDKNEVFVRRELIINEESNFVKKMISEAKKERWWMKNLLNVGTVIDRECMEMKWTGNKIICSRIRWTYFFN